MLGNHDVSRLISSHWYSSQVERAILCPNLLKHWTVACVTREEEALLLCEDSIATPQAVPPVVPPVAPMLHCRLALDSRPLMLAFSQGPS